MKPLAPDVARSIDAVRRFSRFYTRKLGVLEEGLLNSPYSLTEARVLYEIAHRPGILALDLQRDLNLDAGYLSRMLARFARKRLLLRSRSREDGRRVHLRLSPSGQAAAEDLSRRSTEQARQLLAHLSAHDRYRLSGILDSARHLLAAPAEHTGEVTLRGLRAGDLGWVVQRHGELYEAEYQWDTRFEALVARIVADYRDHLQPGRENAWIAELDGHRVGCIFLVRASDTEAKLRLLLVEPSARGRGIGRKLVNACISFARDAGYQTMTLWTNSVLVAARHIYEKAGFRLLRSESHRSFGHDLEGQYWALDLTSPPARTPDP